MIAEEARTRRSWLRLAAIIPAAVALSFWTSASIARAEDGSGWTAVPGFNHPSGVHAMAVYYGSLYVATNAPSIDGIPIHGIAAWNGHGWSDVGGGIGSTGTVFQMAATDTKLYVAGCFTKAYGGPGDYVAAWDGSWSELAGGVAWSGCVETVAVMPGLDEWTPPVAEAVYGAGAWDSAYIAAYTDPVNGWRRASQGEFANSWAGLELNAFAYFNGTRYVGGSFTTPWRNIAYRGSGSWVSAGGGVDFRVFAMTNAAVVNDPDGAALYAGGLGGQTGDSPMGYIAKTYFPSGGWRSLGGGLNECVWALAAFDDGCGTALYAGGGFTEAGGRPANHVAKWDGQSWKPVGSGMPAGAVRSLAVYDGALYAGASGTNGLTFARWEGSSLAAATPSDQTACEGGGVRFETYAHGGKCPWTYQWRKEDQPLSDGQNGTHVISGATTDTLVISGLTASDQGGYDVIVHDNRGAEATSGKANLVVGAALQFLQQPTSQTACVNGTANFSLVAESPSRITSYQWYKDGVALVDSTSGSTHISGATTAALAVNGVTAADLGSYSVQVTSDCGISTSLSATLAMASGPPVFSNPTPAATVTGGCTGPWVAYVSRPATNPGETSSPYLAYQWRKRNGTLWEDLENGGRYSGVHTSTLRIDALQAGETGEYRVVASNGCGSIESNGRSLPPFGSPTVTAGPVSATVCEFATATFSVTATGATAYRWQKFDGTNWGNLASGGNIVGATTPVLTIFGADGARDAGLYRTTVTNSCGTTISGAAQLSVTEPPPQAQPAVTYNCATPSATLSVPDNGTQYQWRKFDDGAGTWIALTDDGRFTGTATATLVINPLLETDHGDYDVVYTPECSPVPLESWAVTLDLTDWDGDGVWAACDNCPEVPNPKVHSYVSGSGTGRFGQPDFDNDGVGDVCDNCPFTANPDQNMDACPPPSDTDGDGIENALDLSPFVASTWFSDGHTLGEIVSVPAGAMVGVRVVQITSFGSTVPAIGLEVAGAGAGELEIRLTCSQDPLFFSDGAYVLRCGSVEIKTFRGEARFSFTVNGVTHEVAVPAGTAAIIEERVVGGVLKGVFVSGFDGLVIVDGSVVPPGGQVAAGSWYPPDFDGDADVDLADFLEFQDCFNGPNRAPKTSGCEGFDFDGDTDVDLADFLEFQDCFNGPNRPPKC